MNNNITEKVERYNEIGQVVRVSLKWRGKTYMLQMFFPGSKFPSRQEVEAQVKKIYPDSVVMVHYASETQPNQPLIRVSENSDVMKVYGGSSRKKGKDTGITSQKKLDDVRKVYVGASHEPDGETIQEMPNELEGGMQKARDIAKRNIIRKKGEELGKSERTSGDPSLKKGGSRSHFNSYQPEGEVVNEEESQNPTFTQFMKRIDQLPEVTREAIKNCGNDPMIAKAALEISGIDK